MQQTTTGSPARTMWNADAVFELFSAPVRQKLFLALARHPWQPPSALKVIVHCSLDGTMKRLAAMRTKGFVVKKGDTVDIRRQLYALAPDIPLVTVDGKKVLDFGFLKVPLESHDSDRTAAGAGATTWDPERVYSALGDPSRRDLLTRLAQKPGQTGQQLNGPPDIDMSGTLKHLHVLHMAGLVVKAPNERDGRRPLYSLSPEIPLVKNGNGVAFEFGFCTVTLS